ncbi:hypothetical protein ATANTOWER_025531 [Ataeniobius toweri]|uniref:Transposase n=1 Tax=Ataeniobius toweri TaxID=208326 RepID=A0ABU7BS45_9TELE|nr:hypothetical protein [Ataeniobius toweri]
MQRQPLDVDYLRFVVNHKILLFRSLLNHVQMPPDVVHGLTVLTTLVNEENAQDFNPSQLPLSQGELGRPKYVVPSQQLQTFTKMSFSVSKIAAILGICPRTVKRRLHDYGMSIKQCYSRLTDEELDTLVRSIKAKTPNIGYRMTKGILQSMSHRVQWNRVSASVHRVDSVGVVKRMAGLCCVARRTYSVPGPLHLVHIDTNH